ncbi:MAG: endolytic transglycosylase MltG [Armatimonadetes bacterium]|nr:endolytic transglycosylase MltG [Armatimonadota bacterium]
MTPEITPTPAPKKRSKAPLFLLALLLLLGGGAWMWNERRKNEALERWKRASIVMPERLARVPARWSAQTLAERLEKSRKIRDSDTFVEYAQQIGLKEVEPGAYFLPKIAGPRDLAQSFKNGPTHEKVTFPEGFTARQVVARLRKNGFAGASDLEKIAPETLEGRLFPETYWLPLRTSGKELAAPMIQKWRETIQSLPRPFPKIDGKEMTPMQLTTLASLVEREAASRAEMPLVAGVIVGRLRRPMRLQIDASIQYARAVADLPYKSRLLYEDLEIQSPYNTYTRDGLPPGPICNPGEAALRAAARPQNTNSLFYVYSPKLKRHIFAPDYSGHLRNVALAKREREQRENAAADAAIASGEE